MEKLNAEFMDKKINNKDISPQDIYNSLANKFQAFNKPVYKKYKSYFKNGLDFTDE